MRDDRIFRIDAIDARHEPRDWPFAHDNAGKIAQLWREKLAANPALWNGRVLLQHRGETVAEGERTIFRAGYFETDYSCFLAWRAAGSPEFGEPGWRVRNGFAMAALRASDGAFLLGEMGPQTANAGMVYFAAGTPDPSDLVEDRVDLFGSVVRELEEETGLAPHEVAIGEGWTVVTDTGRVAFMREVRIDLPAEEARAMIRARLAEQAEPELSDIVIVREAGDIDAGRMPVFMQHFLRDALG